MDRLNTNRYAHFLALVAPLFIIFLPLLVFGQTGEAGGGSKDVGDINTLIGRLAEIVNPLIALLSGFAILAFVRGIAVFVWNGGDEEKRKEGKKFILYGILGLFVLFSFWGAVRFIVIFYFGTGVNSPFPAGGL